MPITNEHGPEERQLRRHSSNPLLAPIEGNNSEKLLEQVRQNDLDREARFLEGLRGLVERCIALKPNEESETILALKAELDQAMVVAAGLKGERSDTLDAITRLTDLIMAAVRRGAEGDAVALGELDQEEAVRRHHRQLLQWPLLSDLMIPDSPIPEGELVATLFGSSDEELDAVLWLFGPEQLSALLEEAERLKARIGTDNEKSSRIDDVTHKIRNLPVE